MAEERIKVGEFRGHGLFRLDAYGHFMADLGRILVCVPWTYGEHDAVTIDPEGPITCGPDFARQQPVTPEEEASLRPLFRALPAQMADWTARNPRVEKPRRTYEEAKKDRERNLARYGLSDAPTDAASMCEAERTPLAPAAPTAERNSGGRCPECGFTHGHRMDCCFA